MDFKDIKIAFFASPAEAAQNAKFDLEEVYRPVPLSKAEVIVALGGDGLMLHGLHQVMDRDVAIYGMNLGTVGFLMNDFVEADLFTRLANAQSVDIHPLKMNVTDSENKTHSALAFNEVSLLRASFQAAKIEVKIDNHIRLDELICDGLLVATPMGSTAYNFSAHGPILPLDAPLLALTPISPFRPRRWRGAILPNHAEINLKVMNPAHRPINAVADYVEFKNVTDVSIKEDRTHKATMLFDPGHALDERLLAEQFRY